MHQVFSYFAEKSNPAYAGKLFAGQPEEFCGTNCGHGLINGIGGRRKHVGYTSVTDGVNGLTVPEEINTFLATERVCVLN